MAIMIMNTEQFNKSVQGGGPVLVEFMAPWCVYCRRIAPALEKLAGQYGGELPIGQVNIDDEPKLAEQERIELVPTFVLYRNGQALGSITAPDSKAKIEAFIQEHLDK
ncbi:MAG: thioredoxin family protein [Candidatus Heteroscillospira sp.]|jgi:thioredoxin